MLAVHLTALLGILPLVCCYRIFFMKKGTVSVRFLSFLLFFAAIVLRFAAAGLSEGFHSDLSCFAAWAERMYSVGASGFYSPEVFTDYPPGYMYVLYLIGMLRSVLNIPYYSGFHLLLLKLPAMLGDLLCGCLLYREASGKLSRSQALCLCTAYLFNPVIILNSAVWGQVDSILTLTVALMCLSLVKGRLFPASLSFCAGLLLKPQMLLFSPILLVGFLDQLFSKDFSLHKLGKNLSGILISFAVLLCLCLPFGPENVWRQYFSTVESYPYAAVNACNLWGLFGLNWISQDNTFLGIPYKLYGYAFILIIAAAVLIISLRHKDHREKYPFLAAVLILTLFVFSVRMHERYLYPGLLLLLFAFIYRPMKALWLCYGGFSLLHFYNIAFVLFFYDPEHYNRKSFLLLSVSAGMLLTVFFLHLFVTPKYFSVQRTGAKAADRYVPQPSKKASPLKKADFLCMALLTLVYSGFALYDLGDTTAPQSSYDMACGDTIILDFKNLAPNQEVYTLAYYIAPDCNRTFLFECPEYPDSVRASETQELTFENVFTWQEITLYEAGGRIQLTLKDDSASLLELVFLDQDGRRVTPGNAFEYPALFDEQELYPKRSSFRNSMYFDEIYHGRTAYEFLHGLTAYETTHPPLGKILISLGVALFGMTPFGWRITGTLFGILMVPMIYLFGKRLTGNTPAAVLTCTLFAFDFMHFTQTRIATIDVYVTFFVLLMYFFMYCYCQKSFYDTTLSKTLLPLGACGVCMGLGIACKWTGIYAGAGLAVLFFAALYRRYGEYRYAKADPEGISSGMAHSHIIQTFFPHTVKTLCFCIFFFAGIPALIYLLSYLPFVGYADEGLFTRMLHNQTAMYRYHSTLNATHPYSSVWYEWPIIKRPVWYYSSIVTGAYGEGGIREGISAFGNPFVWWPGIPAFFHMLYLRTKKKDRTAAFLTIGYLAQYLPWFFVTRITFIYHYFPSVVFVVLMLAYSILQLRKKLSAQGFLALTALYGTAAFLLFLLFYPVLSGQPVDASFTDRWLRWFSSWVLTAP